MICFFLLGGTEMLSKSRAQSDLRMLEVFDLKDAIDTVDAVEAVVFFVVNCFFNGVIMKASFEHFKEFVLDKREHNPKELGSCLVLRPGSFFVVDSLHSFFQDNLPLVVSVIFLVHFFLLMIVFDFVLFWLFVKL